MNMNPKRMRGRNHRGGGGGGGGGGQSRHHAGNIPLNRNHVFDSNGPDLRVRGTAQQLFEKYLQLGRDAGSAGDRVMAESYFQHAEHYFRIVMAMQMMQQSHQPGHGGQPHQNYRIPQSNTDEPAETGDDEPAPAIAGAGDQPNTDHPEEATPQA